MAFDVILQAIVLDALLIFAIYLFGYLLLTATLRSTTWLEILSLGFPLSGGILSFSVFLVSWAGIRISIGSLVILYAVMVFLILAIRSRTNPRLFQSTKSRVGGLRPVIFRHKPFSIVALVFLTGLLLFAIFLSVGRSYSIWDSIATWSVKGYGIALEGSIEATLKYGGFDRAYPLNIPLLISFFRLVSGDVLPGSKMVFPLMVASCILAVYRFWRKNAIPSEIALAGSLFFASMPLFFEHATVGWADMTFACYLVLGVLWAIEGMISQETRAFFLSGVLLGLSCWTRAEGLLYSVGFVLILTVAWKVMTRENPKLLAWFLPLATMVTIWLIYSLSDISSSHLGDAIQAARQSVLSGDWHVGAIWMILDHIARRSFSPSLWGVFVPLGLILLALQWRYLISKKAPVIFTTTIAFVFGALVPIGLFYAGSFLYGLDFVPGWLDRSFDRAFLPALFLFGSAAILVGYQWINEKNDVSKTT